MKDKSHFLNRCDQLSLIVLCLFAGECVLGGSGRWLSFGPISIRMLLFAGCFVLTLPNVFTRLRTLLTTKAVIVTVLLGVYLVVAAVIGWRNGNSLSFIKADLTSYLTFALLPGFLATVYDRQRLNRLLNVVFFCSLALSILTIAIHFYLAFASNYGINLVNDWLNDHHMGGLANLGHGVLRIYIRSHIFLQVAFLLGLHKLWQANGKKRWLLIAAMAVIAFACLLTYTRGFWLGLAASAVLLLLLAPTHLKRYLATVGMVGVLIVGLFCLSWGAYGKPLAALEVAARFNPDLVSGALAPVDPIDPPVSQPTEPTEPDANLEALELRQETLRQQIARISQRPVFGSGLGSNLDGLRTDGKTEYMYHDTLMKTGIVGFALFCGAFFLSAAVLLFRLLKRLKNKEFAQWDSAQMGDSILLSAYVGVAITSYVNPFLINPMGILLAMLLTAAALCKESK